MVEPKQLFCVICSLYLLTAWYKNLMKRFLFITLMVLKGLGAFANHTKGGWMYYEYLGPGSNANTAKYKIVLKLYLICDVGTGPGKGSLDNQINFTIFTGPNEDQIFSNFPVNLTENPDNKNCQNCDPCIVNKPDICYKYATYETTIDLPISVYGYTIAYQRCCRITGIVNIINSSTVGDTWTIHIPGTIFGPSAPLNSSPKFIANDTVVVCANNFFKFDFTATDPDGDSLSYEFAPAYPGGNNSTNIAPVVAATPPYGSVPYQPPFTETSPLGPAAFINQATGVVSGTAPSVGEYVVTVVVKEYRAGNYIAESRKSLHIQVASCNLVVADLLDDLTCDGFTKTFHNNAPDPPGATYQWDFGVPGINTDVSTAPNPTYTYPDTGTYHVTLALSLNGLCTDTATAIVKVYPKLNPDFNITGQCKNTAIQFTDKSQTTYGSINAWSWNFGDPGLNNTAVTANPSHTYTTAGTYTVTLDVNNSKGCNTLVAKTLTIKDQPDLTVTNDTLICSIDTLQLNAVGAGTINWSPNYNINSQTSANPLVSPDVPTKYYITLTDPFGCAAKDSVFVDVKLFVTIDAGRDTGICAGDAIHLNPVSDALHYNWSPAGPLDDPQIKYPLASPAVTTKFYVIGNIGKCQSTDSVTVRVAPYPGAGGIPDTTLCLGNSIQFHETGGSQFSWTPAFYLNNTNIPDPIAKPQKSIRYIVTITDTLGCPKPSMDTIVVKVENVVADAGPPDTSVVVSQPLQLNASGGQFYLWTPPLGLDNAAIFNPIATVSSDIVYTVHASTAAGCFDTDTIHVHVYQVVPGIYVPSAFTPNGDGTNDVFKPIAIGIKQINYFKVYNRWGVLVYSSANAPYEAAIGWDGRYKGRPQDTGVFVWVVEGVDYTGKKIVQKGTVTLIR